MLKAFGYSTTYSHNYSEGWDLEDGPNGVVWKRIPTRDRLLIKYEDFIIDIEPRLHKVLFTGSVRKAAYLFAIFVRDQITLSNRVQARSGGYSSNRSVPLEEIFTFSKEWKIINVDSEFIDAYNKIINSVLLLS